MVDVSCGSVIRVISVILDRLRQDQEARLRSSALGAGPACRDAAILKINLPKRERSTAPALLLQAERIRGLFVDLQYGSIQILYCTVVLLSA